MAEWQEMELNVRPEIDATANTCSGKSGSPRQPFWGIGESAEQLVFCRTSFVQGLTMFHCFRKGKQKMDYIHACRYDHLESYLEEFD